MAAKCPLCGGKTVNNECKSCGYRLPDERDLSSLYNYDPSDYPQEEPKMREIAPDPYMEEIYPNPQNAPKFKVRDDQGKTVNNNNAQQQEYKNNNPYADGTFKPYQTPQNNAGQPFQNPYANNGSFKPYMSSSSNEDFGSFFKQYWWLLLLSFFVPVVGLILYISMKEKIDPKFRWAVITAVVLGFVLPP